MKSKLAIVLLLLGSPALAQNIHMTVGKMDIAGLDGQGTTFEVGTGLLDNRITLALIRNQEYATSSQQSVEESWAGYATFNVINTAKWTGGAGVAYVDYSTTDVHNFRALFGVPPLMGEVDRVSMAFTLNRHFGPVLVGFRHFRLRTSGGWAGTSGVSLLSVGVGF